MGPHSPLKDTKRSFVSRSGEQERAGAVRWSHEDELGREGERLNPARHCPIRCGNSGRHPDRPFRARTLHWYVAQIFVRQAAARRVPELLLCWLFDLRECLPEKEPEPPRLLADVPSRRLLWYITLGLVPMRINAAGYGPCRIRHS